MASYFNRRYLTRRWFSRHFRWTDVLELLVVLAAGALAWAAYSAHPQVTTVSAIVYLVAALIRWAIIVRARRARDFIQGSVFWNLCDRINTEIFGYEHAARFTLFERDRLRWNHIVPRYRYGPGEEDPISGALRSRARFQRGEALAGEAWKSPGKLLLANFPKFETPEQFRDFYVNRIDIRRDVVGDLSEYMADVRSVICYGLEDANHRFLGVLSIDFELPISTLVRVDNRGEGPRRIDLIPDEPGVELDEIRVSDALRAMQSVLAAFYSTPRKN